MTLTRSDLAERFNEIVEADKLADRIPLAQKLREDVAKIVFGDVQMFAIQDRATGQIVALSPQIFPHAFEGERIVTVIVRVVVPEAKNTGQTAAVKP